jgi:hypothetical protein
VEDNDLNPDVAAELRLLRAEIAALRAGPPAPGLPPRRSWVPVMSAGHLILPDRHYRLMASLRRRLHHRAHLGSLTHEHISKQRRAALWLTIFAGCRTLAWIACMAFIGVYALGLGGSFIRGFAHLSSLVLWVSVISYYCNASTDAANLMAGIAALFSSDSHAAIMATGIVLSADLGSLEADVARLADLQPGPEATALAAGIRVRLAGGGTMEP